MKCYLTRSPRLSIFTPVVHKPQNVVSFFIYSDLQRLPTREYIALAVSDVCRVSRDDIDRDFSDLSRWTCKRIPVPGRLRFTPS